MSPLISVIIPVYNVEKYLHKCVDSVLAQTYSNLEIILVDDGSTDSSGQICDEYAAKDPRIRVIHQQNAGVSAARNAGLHSVKGNYIGFVDSDDWIDPDMYQYLLDLCRLHHAEVSICEYQGEKHKPIFEKECLLTPRQWLALPHPIFSACTKLFATKVLNNTQFQTHIIMGEDSLFSTQVLVNANLIVYTPQVKYHYEFNDLSAMNGPFNPKEMAIFKAIELEQQCVNQYPWPEVHTKFQLAKPEAAIRLLGKIMRTNFNGVTETKQLINILNKYKWPYLGSNASILAKLFMFSSCVNFKLTRWLYNLLRG